MNAQPLVVSSLREEQIIEQMKADGVHDAFMAQVERKRQEGNLAAVVGKFTMGNRVVFVAYHFNPADGGFWSMTLFNPTPELVEVARQAVLGLFTGPVEPMYIDDPERRN